MSYSNKKASSSPLYQGGKQGAQGKHLGLRVQGPQAQKLTFCLRGDGESHITGVVGMANIVPTAYGAAQRTGLAN